MEREYKIKKEDLGFVFAQGLFIIYSVIRFYDRAFVPMRNMPLEALKEQRYACLGTFLYFLILLLFSLVSLVYCGEEKKKQVGFLLTVLSVTMIPAFLPENYFGVIDVYSAALGFLSLILLHSKYNDRLVGIFIFLMIRWDITAAISWGLWLLAYTFYLTYRDKESISEEPSGGKKTALLFTVVLYIVACVIPRKSYSTWNRIFEPRYELTLTKGIIAILLLLPMAVLFFRLLYNLAMEMKRFLPRFSYYCLFFAALPAFVVWFLNGDYYRAIFYLTSEAVISMLVLMQGERLRGMELSASHKSIWDSSRWIRVFLLLYLAFVMFFLVYGQPLLLEEQLLEY